jgi:murein DD-endopeptidase MepM/ murein hydrolase activator NlpD
MRPLALTTPYLRGDDVSEVQRRLGFTGDAVDGIYGPDTAAAVEDWKWRVGYPEDRITSRLALRGLAWLLGQAELPPEFAQRAQARTGKARSLNGLARPLATNPGFNSEFTIEDPEGAPDARGVCWHAAKDWFAPGGSPVRAPVSGNVVEVRESRGDSGQIFGGVVKINADTDHKIWVLRHVDPKGVAVGQRVQAGQVVANVTRWKDGSPHVHIELWKTLSGGYHYENMLDPMTYFRALTP